jgi:hypothetical protein
VLLSIAILLGLGPLQEQGVGLLLGNVAVFGGACGLPAHPGRPSGLSDKLEAWACAAHSVHVFGDRHDPERQFGHDEGSS